MAIDYGHLEITLASYLETHGVSKNKLVIAANLQRSQLIAYCRNQIQRPDLDVLARICYALGCDISEILKYIPPESNTSST